MKPMYYTVIVMDDVEPELHGPFGMPHIRDRNARSLRAEYGDEHGIFRLDISRTGEPRMSAYSGAFFAKEDD